MRAALLTGLLLLVVTRVASAETAPALVVDRVAVRFFGPETGGPEHPRFVLQRPLAYQARL